MFGGSSTFGSGFGGFGTSQPAQQQQQPAGAGFGSSFSFGAQPAPTTSTFGSSFTAPGGAFGGQQLGGSLFGGGQQQQQQQPPATTGFGGFGGTGFGTGGFGNTAPAASTGGFSFGASTGSGFGSTSFGGFGAAPASQSSFSLGGFGSNTGSSLFSSTGGAFGSTPASSFGAGKLLFAVRRRWLWLRCRSLHLLAVQHCTVALLLAAAGSRRLRPVDRPQLRPDASSDVRCVIYNSQHRKLRRLRRLRHRRQQSAVGRRAGLGGGGVVSWRLVRSQAAA